MKLAEVQQILQMLLRESVPIRQLAAILETLGDYGPRTRDPILLTEYVRHRLARTICTRYRNHDNRLYVVTLDPALEDRIRAGFDHNEQGLFIRMSPQAVETTCRLIAAAVERLTMANHPPVRAGQPADPRGAEADDAAAPAATGRAQLQRDHPRHEDRIGRHDFRRKVEKVKEWKAEGWDEGDIRSILQSSSFILNEGTEAMELRTFRAPTMHEALAMVRRELGPDAAVLHTREVRARRLFGWFPGPRQIEVTASCEVNVPSRLPPRRRASGASRAATRRARSRRRLPPPPRRRPREVQGQLSDLQAMVTAVVPPLGRRQPPRSARGTVPPFTDLLGFRPERGTGPGTGRAGPPREPRHQAGRPAAGQGPHRADDRRRKSPWPARSS